MIKSVRTRESIIENAFDLIYLKGYQATSIDDILSRTKVTKGAFYYHFKSKDAMGLAVISEIIYPEIHNSLILPIKNSSKPVKDIYRTIEQTLFKASFFKASLGCPLSNMIQEMSPLNADFVLALGKIKEEWRETLMHSIRSGKKAGRIRPGLDESGIADFIISTYWGVRNLGKLEKSAVCYIHYLDELKRYLKSLQ
ncbi:MAG: TetR family transcriptional regulator [Daejeonella sp.]|uniref:TetR/AcrR family transcriptional regulator n=1 Tax=Daejeonella sp. JGW-45 TaxID=3034148 RepID=UPI0023EB78E9|nr:TetR/AcrR family transcriptional regulator [Daejeonella sp. JGW-45]